MSTQPPMTRSPRSEMRAAEEWPFDVPPGPSYYLPPAARPEPVPPWWAGHAEALAGLWTAFAAALLAALVMRWRGEPASLPAEMVLVGAVALSSFVLAVIEGLRLRAWKRGIPC